MRRGADYVGWLIAIAVACWVIGTAFDLLKYGELTEPCCSAPSIASPN